MAVTALGSDAVEPPVAPGCWCCGDRTVQASLVRLGAHPELVVAKGRYRAGLGRC